MTAAELLILINDTTKARERLMARRQTVSDAAETARGQAAEPGHSPAARRAIRTQQIEALGACQRIDNELWAVDSEIRRLKRLLADAEFAADSKTERDEFFNRVRQIVRTDNVVALPFPADHSPEAA